MKDALSVFLGVNITYIEWLPLRGFFEERRPIRLWIRRYIMIAVWRRRRPWSRAVLRGFGAAVFIELCRVKKE